MFTVLPAIRTLSFLDLCKMCGFRLRSHIDHPDNILYSKKVYNSELTFSPTEPKGKDDCCQVARSFVSESSFLFVSIVVFLGEYIASSVHVPIMDR